MKALFSQATPPLHVLFEDDQGYLVNGRFTGPHTLYEERVDASGWPWTYSTPHDLSAWSQSDVDQIERCAIWGHPSAYHRPVIDGTASRHLPA